jgi:hypothetical protein
MKAFISTLEEFVVQHSIGPEFRYNLKGDIQLTAKKLSVVCKHSLLNILEM